MPALPAAAAGLACTVLVMGGLTAGAAQSPAKTAVHPRAVAAIRAAAGAFEVTDGWDAPLPGGRDGLEVKGGFDPPVQDWLPGHRGVDLAAVPGTPVLAPSAGTVTFAGPVAGRNVLVITHDDGLRSSFEPVTGTVTVGTRVAAGTAVGLVDDTAGHCAPASCLHWGVRRGETYLDPLAFLGMLAPIVLLPIP